MTPLHRAYLALLVAVLDGDDHRAHAVINGTDPTALAHYTARKFIATIDADDHDEMRTDLETELLEDGD